MQSALQELIMKTELLALKNWCEFNKTNKKTIEGLEPFSAVAKQYKITLHSLYINWPRIIKNYRREEIGGWNFCVSVS